MADALEVSNQGGQPRAEQAPLLDGRGQGRLVGPGAVLTPVFGAGVLPDGQRGLLEIDLLHHPSQAAVAAQRAATAGAGVQEVFGEQGDLLGGERSAFLSGMAGLPAPPAGGSVGTGRGLGRLNDVGGGGLGGRRGVFACRGQLLLELGHGGAQGLDLLLQALASRTGGG